MYEQDTDKGEVGSSSLPRPTSFLKLDKVFKEIEDKRIKTAKTKMKTNELKKEAKLDKSINKETKSVKERLIDLKSMFNEDLITKEEYEEQRKNLISEI